MDVVSAANLALDFMNPESRRISGVYENFTVENHVKLLEGLLNVYILWCGEYCILPPGVAWECSIADSALRKKILFLRERLIRCPMSNMNIPQFLRERRYEYQDHKSYFPDLFNERETAVAMAPEAVVAKLTKTGASLADIWETLPERIHEGPLPKWANPTETPDIAGIAAAPRRMIRRGETLTWPDVRRELRSLPKQVSDQEARRWLQHTYLETYNNVFGLKTIRNLPAQLPELGYLEGELAYDYDAIKEIFELWGLFQRVLTLSASQIVRMRRRPGFARFRTAFEIAARGQSMTELKGRFALASTRVLSNPRHGFSPLLFRSTFSDIEDELDAFFEEIGNAVITTEPRPHSSDTGVTTVKKFKDIRIGVMMALAEEYKLFCRYFEGLVIEKYHVNDLTVDIFQSERDGKRIGVVCVNRMGNIPAAIAATRMFQLFDLHVIINIGLAAGTNRGTQNLGDIVVAEKIRYYESGKIQVGAKVPAPEYAIVGSHFVDQLATADYASWRLGASVGGKPRNVFFGTIASGEKVVADQAFVDALLSQDRKIMGIEMESYGIAAAAFARQEKLVLIRGITDFGDGAKNDDARLSAMEGAVRFLNEALRHGLLCPDDSDEPSIPIHLKPEYYDLKLSRTEILGDVANNYVEVSRSVRVEAYTRRRSIIDTLAKRGSIDEIRGLCVALGIDFDELRGDTKTGKAASLLEHIERKGIFSLDDLESIVYEKYGVGI